jgi:hypothetical protein
MQDTKVVRINISNELWREFRLESIRARKPAAYILGELCRRWIEHQQKKERPDE